MQRLTDFSASTLAHVERHTCFCATNELYCVCRSAVFTVVQGWLTHLCAGRGWSHISACCGVIFMPGKSPPCRILTLVAKNCKSFLFRKKKADLQPRQRRKPGREKQTGPSRQNANVGHFWRSVGYKKEETDNSGRSKRWREKRGFAACRKMRATHYGPQAVF